MANDRLFLIHRQSGSVVCIGKRMARGWYAGNPNSFVDKLNEFYDRCTELTENSCFHKEGIDSDTKIEIVTEDDLMDLPDTYRPKYIAARILAEPLNQTNKNNI